MGMGKKITDLATGIPAVTDWMEYIDRADTTMSPSGTNKKALFSNISEISAIDTDGTMAANSDTRIASQKATRTYIASVLAGVSKNKGPLNCSANPNYPVALNGDFYRCSVAGKVGGASGVVVEVADLIMCVADNAGGTQASVGTSWVIGQANIAGITTAGLAMMQAADEEGQAALLAEFFPKPALAGNFRTLADSAVLTYADAGVGYNGADMWVQLPNVDAAKVGAMFVFYGYDSTSYPNGFYTDDGNTIKPPSGSPVSWFTVPSRARVAVQLGDDLLWHVAVIEPGITHLPFLTGEVTLSTLNGTRYYYAYLTGATLINISGGVDGDTMEVMIGWAESAPTLEFGAHIKLQNGAESEMPFDLEVWRSYSFECLRRGGYWPLQDMHGPTVESED